MNTKVTVTIDARKPSNMLRLRWAEGTVTRSLALGLKDTLPNRALAKGIKKRIEEDCKSGIYDPSLFSYRLQTIGSNAADITAPELFAKFTAHKLKVGDISQHTASVGYSTIQSILRKHLNKPVSTIGRKSAEALADHFANVSPGVAKQQLFLIRACWAWAVGQYQVKDVWGGLNTRFKVRPRRDIEPFAKDEVRAIVNGFKNTERYCHLADFVICLFGTGARIGEIVALTWADVKPDYSTIWIGKSTTGKFQNDTTKTGKARNVILSPTVAAMLKARREAHNPSPSDLVFHDKDKPIHNDIFLLKWKVVLKKAGVTYRKPYSMRHTAISHALEAGANPLDVAAQCGHDIKTLFSRYAHVIQSKQIFTEF
jgi:integrase